MCTIWMSKSDRDMCHAQAASGVYTRYSQVIGVATSGMKNGAKALSSSMEECDLATNDLSFLIKYKKDRQGNTLTRVMARALLTTTAGQLEKLMESTRSLKALLPSKNKDEN